jgi:DUF3097 family protein
VTPDRYTSDVLASDWRAPARGRATPAEATVGLVVEEVMTDWCGEIVSVDRDLDVLTLEDRRGRRRSFPLGPGFLLEGRPVVLTAPVTRPGPAVARRTASGSVAVTGGRARVARESRIFVEGRHDAELVEKVWGDDLRVEGVVVERLDGVDHLADAVRAFAPGPGRRLGVLVDHLVDGSKEARLAAAVRHPDVLVTGTPYVDVWQAVRPRLVGLDAWPEVPKGRPWKDGVCAALGETNPGAFWRQLLSRVTSYRDLETPFVGAVEALVDFVTGA